jgi:hypothetical protein
MHKFGAKIESYFNQNRCRTVLLHIKGVFKLKAN